MRRRFSQHIALGLLVLVLTLTNTRGSESQAGGPDEIVIIVNKSIVMNSISKADVRSLFLKQRTSINGIRFIPINAMGGTALRSAFQKQFLGMNLTGERTYWQNQGIRMGLEAPAKFSNPVKAVFRLKKGIGYSFRKDIPAGVVRIVPIQ